MEIKYKEKIDIRKGVLETYEFVLKEMSYEFSSTAFIRALRDLGFSESMIQSQKHLRFLKRKCQRLTRNTFSKKTPKNEIVNIVLPIQENKEASISNLTVSQCIDFLKSNGYKVYKPITEFIEL
jgi:hypothetical protein